MPSSCVRVCVPWSQPLSLNPTTLTFLLPLSPSTLTTSVPFTGCRISCTTPVPVNPFTPHTFTPLPPHFNPFTPATFCTVHTLTVTHGPIFRQTLLCSSYTGHTYTVPAGVSERAPQCCNNKWDRFREKGPNTCIITFPVCAVEM